MPMLRNGDLVRHLHCPEWGVGIVIEINGTMAVLCFEHSDRHREFRVPSEMFAIAADVEGSPPTCKHKVARAAPSRRKPSAPKVTQTLEQLLAAFRGRCPEGFASKAFAEERALREKTAAALRGSLASDRWKTLVGSSSFEELGRAHREIVQKSNLIHPVQAMKLAAIRDGAYWTAYGEWTWSAEWNESAFDLLLQGLVTAGQASWPNVTALRAVLHPSTDLLVKPESMKRAAAALGHEIGYESKPSLEGYRRLLAFAQALRERLASEGLRAEDLWDVAGFVRLAAPEEAPKPKKKAAAKSAAAATPSGGEVSAG